MVARFDFAVEGLFYMEVEVSLAGDAAFVTSLQSISHWVITQTRQLLLIFQNGLSPIVAYPACLY